MRSHVSSMPVPLDDKYSWQILRGKDGTHATAWALRAAQVGSTLTQRHCALLDTDLAFESWKTWSFDKTLLPYFRPSAGRHIQG